VAAPTISRHGSARLSREQWLLLALLVSSICINYLDRGSLSVGQSYITRELHIDPARLGMIFSAFFWTYASLQIFSGMAVDRWHVNRVFGLGYLLWSLAMIGTGLAAGLGSLLALRLVLGAGESVAYPAYSRILAASFREEQRGLANALIDAGSKTGPAIGVLVGGLAMERFGWRVFFVAMGAISLIWLLPWTRYAPASTPQATPPDAQAPTVARILRLRSAWGTFLGLICGNYAWYFMVFWLPPYFENERRLSHHDMSILGSAPFWGVAVTSVCGGWLSDRLIALGFSANLVRKTFVCAGLLLATLMLPAMLVRDNRLSVAFLTVACASFGLFSSNHWALTQTLAGPHAAGKWTGIENAIGNLPGMLGLWFTGWVIQVTGHYFMAFAIACGFLVAGAICYGVVIRRVEEAEWF
jgi:ACS family D-galactonate transporter-like MFS transporter